MRNSISIAAFVAAAATAPGLAFAQEQTPQAAAGDPIHSMADAVQIAETELQGRAIEAERETADDRLVYEIEVVKGDEIHKALVDAESGDVLSTDRQTIEGAWRDWFDSDDLEAVKNAPQSLGAILATVEQDVGGIIREADLDEEDGRYYYEIELVRGAGEGTGAFRDEVYVDISGDVLPGEPDD